MAGELRNARIVIEAVGHGPVEVVGAVGLPVAAAPPEFRAPVRFLPGASLHPGDCGPVGPVRDPVITFQAANGFHVVALSALPDDLRQRLEQCLGDLAGEPVPCQPARPA